MTDKPGYINKMNYFTPNKPPKYLLSACDTRAKVVGVPVVTHLLF